MLRRTCCLFLAAFLLVVCGCGGDSGKGSKSEPKGSEKTDGAKGTPPPNKDDPAPKKSKSTNNDDSEPKDKDSGTSSLQLNAPENKSDKKDPGNDKDGSKDGDKKGTSSNESPKSTQTGDSEDNKVADSGSKRPVPRLPPNFKKLAEARKFGWEAAQMVVESLKPEERSVKFDGMKAWKTDFEIAAANVDPKNVESLDTLDLDKLVTHNPNFWRMYYEIVPGDPAVAFLLGGLYLAAGDAQRARAAIHIVRHHRGDEVKSELELLQKLAMNVIAEGGKHVKLGESMMAEGRPKDAEQLFVGAARLWPQNGLAWQQAAAALLAQDDSGAVDSPQKQLANEFRGKARRFEPFLMEVYLDDRSQFKKLQAVIAGADAWNTVSTGANGASNAVIEAFIKCCIAIENYDLALFAHQILVARRRRYDKDIVEQIKGVLNKIAPGPTTDLLIKRLEQPHADYYVMSTGQAPKSEGNSVAIPSAISPRTNGVKIESIQILSPRKEFLKQVDVRQFGAFQRRLDEVIYEQLGNSDESFKLRLQISIKRSPRNHAVIPSFVGSGPKEKLKIFEKLEAVQTIHTIGGQVEYAILVDVRKVNKDEDKP